MIPGTRSSARFGVFLAHQIAPWLTQISSATKGRDCKEQKTDWLPLYQWQDGDSSFSRIRRFFRRPLLWPLWWKCLHNRWCRSLDDDNILIGHRAWRLDEETEEQWTCNSESNSSGGIHPRLCRLPAWAFWPCAWFLGRCFCSRQHNSASGQDALCECISRCNLHLRRPTLWHGKSSVLAGWRSYYEDQDPNCTYCRLRRSKSILKSCPI